MATLIQGSNTKDHVAYFKDTDGLLWGEFEEVTGLKIKQDGKVQFYEPGSAFERHGGNNFKIDDIEGTRAAKHATLKQYSKKFLDAAVKGQSIRGTLSFHERQANGTVAAAPYVSLNVLVDGVELPDVKSASDKADMKVVWGADGAPIA